MDIAPELRNRLKAVAALKGKTMREWLTEAIIDAGEGLAALGDTEGSMSLDSYLKSRKG